MKDLIEALTIIDRYVAHSHRGDRNPTNCSHDTFAVLSRQR